MVLKVSYKNSNTPRLQLDVFIERADIIADTKTHTGFSKQHLTHKRRQRLLSMILSHDVYVRYYVKIWTNRLTRTSAITLNLEFPIHRKP